MMKPMFCDAHGPECLGAVIVSESTLQGATGELHCRVVVVEFFAGLRCAQGERAANGQIRIIRHQALRELEGAKQLISSNIRALFGPLLLSLFIPAPLRVIVDLSMQILNISF